MSSDKPTELNPKPGDDRVFSLCLCTALFILATFVHFWRLSAIPPGFFFDESAIAYNAWSLLQTGADEYGTRWPLFLPLFRQLSRPGDGLLSGSAVRGFRQRHCRSQVSGRILPSCRGGCVRLPGLADVPQQISGGVRGVRVRGAALGFSAVADDRRGISADAAGDLLRLAVPDPGFRAQVVCCGSAVRAGLGICDVCPQLRASPPPPCS